MDKKKTAKSRSGNAKAKSVKNLPVKSLKAKGVKGGFTAVEHGATEKKTEYYEVKLKDALITS